MKSEEVDSRSCGELKKQRKTVEEEGSRRGGDGSSNEVVKRRRGRPLGSKNKPQPPVVITREFTDSSPAMRPHVLEIPAGHDVAAALAAFSRHRNLGLCVLAAVGPVANVTLRQSPFPVEGSHSAAAVVTFGGRFDILSISATFFPPSLPAVGGGFSVSLAGPQGRVVGGMVAGPLVAAGTVVVVAAAFAEPTFSRLPVEEEMAGSASASLSAGGGSGGGDEVAVQPHQDEDDHNDHDEEALHHHQHRHYHHHLHHGSSDGTPIYAGHFPPDVLWPPTARFPHPPPPPYRFT